MLLFAWVAVAQHGHVDVVKLLLKANANVDMADPNLDRPLHYACQEGNPEVVKVLLLAKVHFIRFDHISRMPIVCASAARALTRRRT